jgi:hypothetical protein
MIERLGSLELYDNLGKVLSNEIPIGQKAIIFEIIRQLSTVRMFRQSILFYFFLRIESQRKVLRNSTVLPLVCKFMCESQTNSNQEIMANSLRTLYYLMNDDGISLSGALLFLFSF